MDTADDDSSTPLGLDPGLAAAAEGNATPVAMPEGGSAPVAMGRRLPDPPCSPITGPPARRPGSVRRTSAILMTWPGGWGTQLRMDGRARDLITPAQGGPVVLADDEVHAGIGADRTIEDLAVAPGRPGIGRLVGARAGGGLRAAIGEALPDDLAGGTPLYLLLDDLAGGSLIAGFAWSRWSDQWRDRPQGEDAPPKRTMVGVCSGFRPGSSALGPDGAVHPERRHNVASVPALVDPDDPVGWHPLDPHPPVAMRRARRIDVWFDGDIVRVDAMFRDSCWQPDGAEVSVHEYALAASIGLHSGLVTAVTAEPRVLPFPECPAAADNAGRLVGTPARDLRSEVLNRLRATDGCTHLNDALRALAEVPVLASALSPAGR